MKAVITKAPAGCHDIDLDIGIDGECPICAKLRDPKTGALPFNAKVRAAIEEGEAIFRGELPGRWYKPHEFEEALKDLDL